MIRVRTYLSVRPHTGVCRHCSNPSAHRIVNQLGKRMEAKLEHDSGSMCLYGPDGDSVG